MMKYKNPLSLLKKKKTWALLVPMLLVACSSILPDFESSFDSNDRIDRKTIKVNSGVRNFDLSYLINGNPEGQRVIFVHGTPGDAAGWIEYLYNAPKDMEFISIDRPGFGKTRPKRATVSLDEQAAVLLPLLESGNGKPPILVGHSLGGPIVAAAAANYPDKVGAVIQLASAVDPGLEDVLFIQYVGNTPPISWLLPKAASNSNKELIWLEGELNLLSTKLDKIVQPVTIIHATDDSLVPYANVPYMEKTFINAAPLEIVTLEGVDHFLPWNSQPTLMKEIRKLSNRLNGIEDANVSDETLNWDPVKRSSGPPPGEVFKELK
ncbi:alpha/beta fold hydrolase [Kordiimonas sp. SCSIO 12610]|uniref:alpha/beta fold hydrolase n=1 Tax=Kordiimonas sp. SCSIO 12610 TaxID=2829597 RepID=UPI00210E817A|nr:alpha/beta hydrolase [Kordiimonas sp. SCSIO 12610]UTW55191.1 alpha/beta hydrolase [Kordiimonas sp. SCSIO 12610]